VDIAAPPLPALQSPLDRPRISPGASREAIRASAEEFEAMFLGQLLAPLFQGVGPDPKAAFGGGAGEDAFRPFLIQEYGKLITARGGIGIADSVERELLKMQGLDVPPPPGVISSDRFPKRGS
jgi:peptidoglycan hydrolase FlgJ